MTNPSILILLAGLLLIAGIFLNHLIADLLQGRVIRRWPLVIMGVPRPGARATNYLTHITISPLLIGTPMCAPILAQERAEQQLKRRRPWIRLTDHTRVELWGKAVEAYVTDPTNYETLCSREATRLVAPGGHYPQFRSWTYDQALFALVALRRDAAYWAYRNRAFVEWARGLKDGER